MGTENAFLQYAKSLEEAEKKRNERPTFNTFQQKEYEEIKWAALEPEKDKVIRILGNPPGYGQAKNSDARVVVISRIVADDGKVIRVCRPSYEYFVNNGNTPEYFLDKVIKTAKSNRWINGKRTCVLQEKNPSLYNKIDKNGFDPSDFRYKVDRGWAGRAVFLANVIDRSQMGWHRDNKHSMLLSKKVTIKGDREYAEDGVPAFGFVDKIIPKIVAYGVWEDYDIAVRKTGQMSNPYQVCVASRVPEEVQADVRPFIVEQKGLTEEEASWERYDLNKLYSTTTYTKLWNRLRNTIKEIDVTLGTSFYDELKELADKERKELEAKAAENNEDSLPFDVDAPTDSEMACFGESLHNIVVPMPEPGKTIICERGSNPDFENWDRATYNSIDNSSQRAGEITAVNAEENKPTITRERRPNPRNIDWSLLPYANLLNDKQKSMITSVKAGENGSVLVKYNTDEFLYCCVENCGIDGIPESFTICPKCGKPQV